MLSEAEKKALYDEIKATYDAQADPRYGGERGWWIDAKSSTRRMNARGSDDGARSVRFEFGCAAVQSGSRYANLISAPVRSRPPSRAVA